MTSLQASAWVCVRGLRFLAVALTFLCAGRAVGALEAPFEVRYRSAESVYVDNGTAGGLAVGDRLEVVRSGDTIAKLVVVFVAEHSASCELVDESVEVITGDAVWGEGGLATALEEQAMVEAAAEAAPRVQLVEPGFNREPREDGVGVTEADLAGARDSVFGLAETGGIGRLLETGVLRRIERERRQARKASAAKPGSNLRLLEVSGLSTCLRVRSGPDPGSAVEGCLAPGTLVTEIGALAGWKRIVPPGGREGWSAARYLRSVSPAGRSSQASQASQRADTANKTNRRSFDAEAASLGSTAKFRARHRSGDSLYLDGGEQDGLAIGDRLEAIRDGRAIAELEIFAVTTLASVSRVLSEERRVVVDDQLRRLPAASAAPSAKPVSRPIRVVKDTFEFTSTRPELALDTSAVEPVRWSPPPVGRPLETRVRGSVTFDQESFSDRTEAGAGSGLQRSEARLNFRASDIGGRPYEFRLRMRKQQTVRDRPGSAFVLETEQRNRFYEMSLSFDPAQGRYAYRLGRMSASPYLGVGYIDGFLGQIALTSSIEVGGFLGMRADVEGFGFNSKGHKYGVFSRFTSSKTDSGLPWQVVLAGIREQGKLGVSREYFTVQSRYDSNNRWSLYQRAEVDFNRGWRKELSGSSTQLSNVALTATARIAEYGRFSVSYDRFEQYRTEETRLLPEDVFNDLLRQGFRTSLQIGSPRGINATLSAGLRTQEGESSDTLSYGLSVRHADVGSRGLSLGLNYLGFSNQFTSGHVGTLKASQRLPGGHQVSLTLGDRLSRNMVFDEQRDRTSQWVRLGAWFELPKGLFANAEYELIEGDDAAGQRTTFGLGYRF